MKTYTVQFPMLLELILEADSEDDALDRFHRLIGKSPIAPAVSADYLAFHCDAEAAFLQMNADDGGHNNVTWVSVWPTDEGPKPGEICPHCRSTREVYWAPKGAPNIDADATEPRCLVCGELREDVER